MNLVVLFSIVIAAALLVPPFAGVDTVMNDNGSTDTNLPVGSVAYGKDVRVKDLKKKDKIIFSEGSSTYVYEITDMDSSAGAYEVKDPYSKSGDTEAVSYTHLYTFTAINSIIKAVMSGSTPLRLPEK